MWCPHNSIAWNHETSVVNTLTWGVAKCPGRDPRKMYGDDAQSRSQGFTERANSRASNVALHLLAAFALRSTGRQETRRRRSLHSPGASTSPVDMTSAPRPPSSCWQESPEPLAAGSCRARYRLWTP